MTWLRLDDEMPDDPKIAGLTDGAFRLYVTGLCYASHHLTDGVIPKPLINRWGVRNADRAATELQGADLWILREDGTGWEINNYLDYQRSKAEVEDISAKRSASGKKGGRPRGGKANGNQSAFDLLGKPEANPNPPTTTTSTCGGESSDTYDYTPVAGGSSSWAADTSDEDLVSEAGRCAARLHTGHKRNGFDAYATGAANNIWKTRRHLIPRLRESGMTFDQAAFTLAQRDADEFLDRFLGEGPDPFAELGALDDLPIPWEPAP